MESACRVMLVCLDLLEFRLVFPSEVLVCRIFDKNSVSASESLVYSL